MPRITETCEPNAESSVVSPMVRREVPGMTSEAKTGMISGEGMGVTAAVALETSGFESVTRMTVPGINEEVH